jgi:methionine-R-sulfoxide reductase
MKTMTRRLAGFFVIALAACTASDSTAESMKKDTMMRDSMAKPMLRTSKPSQDVLKKELTPLQFSVTQLSDTERPFQNEYWDQHADGIYVDITTGQPLFSSSHKFDSGTGWPSFYQPIDKGVTVDIKDSTHGMERVEVRSKVGDAHLGHVFDDGPKPTGLRYCINSASLRFVPVAQLEEEGYGQYRALFEKVKP